jgi:hypothetical protein
MTEVRYAPVRLGKFCVLSLATFGLYDIVWFYRNWRYVRDSEGSRVWPVARAFFGPLFYYGLLKRLSVPGPVGLAAAYLLLTALWRLPDPYWLFASLSFVALLPALSAINALNGGAAPEIPSYGWRKRSVAVACVGSVIFAFAGIGMFGPSTAVVPGADVRTGDLAYLRDSGLLEDNEELLYFYSPGFLSIEGVGVLATDWGVTSYWTDPISEELGAAFLAYGDIEQIETNAGADVWGNTVVRVTGRDGSWFVFVLSSEGGGDAAFVEEIERRRATAPPTRQSVA